MVTIVCLSDTHGFHDRFEVPDGHILIHAGDMTWRGEPEQVEKFGLWLDKQPHPHKIVIAGNRDWHFQRQPRDAQRMLRNAIYLQDSGVTIEGLKFWGSPWQPFYLDWAFNLQRGPEIRSKWDLIPSDTDILITRGTPAGILDVARGEHFGCADLLAAVQRFRPRLHIFGHIHEARGTMNVNGTLCINASSALPWYKRWRPPVVLRVGDNSVEVVAF